MNLHPTIPMSIGVWRLGEGFEGFRDEEKREGDSYPCFGLSFLYIRD